MKKHINVDIKINKLFKHMVIKSYIHFSGVQNRYSKVFCVADIIECYLIITLKSDNKQIAIFRKQLILHMRTYLISHNFLQYIWIKKIFPQSMNRPQSFHSSNITFWATEYNFKCNIIHLDVYLYMIAYALYVYI